MIAPRAESTKIALPSTEAESAALTPALSWLQKIDDEKYDASWSEAAESFRKAVAMPKWAASMESFRKPLGACEGRKLRSIAGQKNPPGAPQGDYVVMIFETNFARKQSAMETVTFERAPDGGWRASGYFIR